MNHLLRLYRQATRLISSSRDTGFTLIEILVVASIIALTSSFMAINFSRSRVDLNQTSNVFVSNLKNIQAQSAASSKYGGLIRCGYGIRYVSTNSYAIYVGPNAEAPNNCASYDRSYGSGDTDIRTITFANSKVEFKSAFADIFFEPPNPKTYFGNNGSLNQPALSVVFGEVGGDCPQKCKTIYVHPSGKIE